MVLIQVLSHLLLCGTVLSQRNGYQSPSTPIYSVPGNNFVNSNSPLIGSPSAQVNSNFDDSFDSFTSPVYQASEPAFDQSANPGNFGSDNSGSFSSSSFDGQSDNSGFSDSSNSGSFGQNSGNFDSSSSFSGNSGNFESGDFGSSSSSNGDFGSSSSGPLTGIDVRANSQRGAGFSGSSNQGNSGFSGSSSQRGSGSRSGSGSGNAATVPGGVDFSQAERTADGRLCVIKYSEVESLAKDPLLECKHKNVKKCHYTYITQFKSAQEEVCEENFEKLCQITFKQQSAKEVVRKCYRPQAKVCNGQGPEQCRTVYESSCTTKYIEKGNGKNVGDTKCEKLPIEICGAGCVTEEGPEECHDKEIDVLVDVPEEVCDLNPQKTCKFVTRLVPSLKPVPECTTIPQEVCNLKFTNPRKEKKPLKSEWCLDESPTSPDADTYEASASQQISTTYGATQPIQSSYGAAQPIQSSYGAAQPIQSSYGAQPIRNSYGVSY